MLWRFFANKLVADVRRLNLSTPQSAPDVVYQKQILRLDHHDPRQGVSPAYFVRSGTSPARELSNGNAREPRE